MQVHAPASSRKCTSESDGGFSGHQRYLKSRRLQHYMESLTQVSLHVQIPRTALSHISCRTNKLPKVYRIVFNSSPLQTDQRTTIGLIAVGTTILG